MKTNKEAWVAAEDMMKQVRGQFSGFKPRVWQNLGWHAEITSAYVTVHYDEPYGVHQAPKYTAYLNREGKGGTGDEWHHLGAGMVSAETVCDAIRLRLVLVRGLLTKLQAEFDAAVASMNGGH